MDPTASKVFARTRSSTDDAFVRWWDPIRDHIIAKGFKEAADIVVGHVTEEDLRQDRYLFPVAFLYRHALEVSIKHLLRECAKLFNATADSQIAHHDLAELWTQAQTYLVRLNKTGTEDFVRPISKAVEEFKLYDRNAQAFRYATTKQGTANLCDFPEAVTLSNTMSVMSEVFLRLDSCVSVIQAEAEARRLSQAELP